MPCRYKIYKLDYEDLTVSTPLSEASRRFMLELMNMLNRKVRISLTSGAEIEGTLLGFNDNLDIVLGDVTLPGNKKIPRMVIMRHIIGTISLTEERLELRELAKILEKYFPGMVRYVEEANIILVGDRIRVTEAGVEGAGPLAKRVKEIFDEFLRARR